MSFSSFVIQHAPVLQVILPLIAAPICLLLRPNWLCALWATLVGLGCLLLVILNLQTVLDAGVISYPLGGWLAPWGIEYRIDISNAYVALIVSGIALLCLLYSWRSVKLEVDHDRLPAFYSLFLLCVTGLLGIVITGDAFNLFVFLEISSLSSYALIALGRDRRALTSSYQYLIMGTIGATFFLIGIGLLYMITGTLNMQDLAVRLLNVESQRTVHVAFAFIVVGLSLKIALFPLHLWLPNAYTYSPSVVSALLAATSTKVAVYALLRMMFGVFSYEYVFLDLPLATMLMPLALIGIFYASVVAIFQNNAKRLFAYSSVAQIGYMVVGIALATVGGLTATLLHLFNHALMKGALFLALGAVAYRIGSTQFNQLDGLGKRMPWTGAALVIGGLSLIGIPLTAGFISKWVLIFAVLEKHHWSLALLLVLSSLLAVIYVWRLVEHLYFKADPNPAREIREAPLSLLIPTWILIIANIVFGIHTQLTIGVAQQAASQLLGGGG